MTPKDLAALMHGRQYRSEITPHEAAQAKAAGLVVMFGYSDDNVELRGAIGEEVSAYDGTTFRVSGDGHALIDWEALDKDDEAEVERYFQRKRNSSEIEALWCPTDTAGEVYASWAFKTDIPHETFDVMEDGELFCRGIVFALADVMGAVSAPGLVITGDILSIGELTADELAALAGRSHAMLRQDDERKVHIIGLSLEECRCLAPVFLDRATLTLGAAS